MGAILQVGLMLVILALILTAVHVQLTGSLRLAAMTGVLAVGFAMGLAWHLGQGRLTLWILAGLVLLAGGWWLSIRPSNTRDWAADVEFGVTAIAGDKDLITLQNVRNFRWTSPQMYTPEWKTKTYDLGHLNRLDVLTSAWGGPAVAHLMVSFGFDDGRHVVFSTEIRREKGEAFSIIGGFFKEYELVLIAAEETDIIRLRTDMRGEQVSLFQLDVGQPIMAEAFRNFAALGNELAEKPRFYNTITNNCTTIPWRLARRLSPNGLPLDWRVVLSGHFPAYMQDIGVTGQGQTRNEMLAWARLRGTGPDPSDPLAYSAALRAIRH